MGLDATVMCNCYREGKTTEPPVARELIHVDEEGYLSLNLPDESHAQEHNDFWEWQQDCCEHEDMDFAAVRVANWAGYRMFQQALKQADWSHFPTLREELPNANGGQTSAQAARLCLKELEYFRCHFVDSNFFLVDSQTEEVVREYVAAYQGLWVWGAKPNGIDLGIDSQGFFVNSNDEPPRELFRSMRFEQRIREHEKRRPDVEFIDLENGNDFRCHEKVDNDSHAPRYLHVEERIINATKFDYILQPLTEIFQAAIETGNPVRWC